MDGSKLWALLDLDTVNGTYYWEFRGEEFAPVTWTCPKESFETTASMGIGNAVPSGTWDPAAPQLHMDGSDDADFGNDVTEHWTWSIDPAAPSA
jgi:hypothetical protein